MKTRIRRDVRHAIVLRPRDLTSLWSVLSAAYPKCDIVAHCVDGSILETANLEELLAFDNPSYRRIESLTVQGNASYEEKASVEFDERASFVIGSSTSSLTISSSDDKKALHIASEVMNRVHDARPTYSVFTHIKLSWALLCGFVAYGLTQAAWRIATGRPASAPISSLTIDILNFVLLIYIALFILAWPINRIQQWLFPRLFFALGRQAEELARREKWRSIVFVSLGVSIAASLIAAFIYAQIA